MGVERCGLRPQTPNQETNSSAVYLETLQAKAALPGNMKKETSIHRKVLATQESRISALRPCVSFMALRLSIQSLPKRLESTTAMVLETVEDEG